MDKFKIGRGFLKPLYWYPDDVPVLHDAHVDDWREAVPQFQGFYSNPMRPDPLWDLLKDNHAYDPSNPWSPKQDLPEFFNPDILVQYQPPSMPDFVGPMPMIELKRGEDYLPKDPTKKPDGVVIIGYDPGSRGIAGAAIRMLLSNAGYKVEGVVGITLEMGEDEIRRRMQILDESFDFSKLPLSHPVLITKDYYEPEKPKTHGPPRKSKHQRGRWWNK